MTTIKLTNVAPKAGHVWIRGWWVTHWETAQAGTLLTVMREGHVEKHLVSETGAQIAATLEAIEAEDLLSAAVSFRDEGLLSTLVGRLAAKVGVTLKGDVQAVAEAELPAMIERVLAKWKDDAEAAAQKAAGKTKKS